MKIRKQAFNGIACLWIAASVVACTPVAATPPASEVETVVAVTFAAMTASATKKTLPAPIATTEIPLEAFVSYRVRTSVQNVNLRVGPGTLFKVSRVMAQGTLLEVNGRSPGGEWLYVKNEEGIFGWVGVNLVESGYDGPPAPFVEPGDILGVTGVVKTELGTPVSGIGFALTQVGFSTRRTDAVTDREGRFHAYIPSTLTGKWMVEYVSVACTSNTMDSNCNCINGVCGEALPLSIEITLPMAGELTFVWK
jgi:uncharacterized protein YraI